MAAAAAAVVAVVVVAVCIWGTLSIDWMNRLIDLSAYIGTRRYLHKAKGVEMAAPRVVERARLTAVEKVAVKVE
jgi:hypothetical protein